MNFANLDSEDSDNNDEPISLGRSNVLSDDTLVSQIYLQRQSFRISNNRQPQRVMSVPEDVPSHRLRLLPTIESSTPVNPICNVIQQPLCERITLPSGTLDRQSRFSDRPIRIQSHQTTKPTGSQRYRLLSPRQKFVVFIKVLLKVIEQQNDQGMLRCAKGVVADCTQRNRLGDLTYSPLQEVITIRLRLAVGDMYWNLAKNHCSDS